MNLYASEVDNDQLGNEQYLELWQDQFGSIHRKLARCTCINCEQQLKNEDSIFYVALHNGKILSWHKECDK